MNEVDRYRGYVGDSFIPYSSRKWRSINVLEFLYGEKLTEKNFVYVQALRPSNVRITTGTVSLDSRIWRVTIFVDENDIIKKIEQEVEIGIPDDEARKFIEELRKHNNE